MSLKAPMWKAAQRAELIEARERSDAMTLSERTEEAVALYLLTLAELARRAENHDQLLALLARDEPLPSLRARWEARARR